VIYHATHDFEPKPLSRTPNLSSRAKLLSRSMMASNKLCSKLTSSNHLASLGANRKLRLTRATSEWKDLLEDEVSHIGEEGENTWVKFEEFDNRVEGSRVEFDRDDHDEVLLEETKVEDEVSTFKGYVLTLRVSIKFFVMRL